MILFKSFKVCTIVRSSIRTLSFSRPKMDDILNGVPHGEHLLRTQGQTRSEEKLDAKIIKICDLSPTVKGLTLKAEPGKDRKLSFRAGQWVDFFIPGVDKVGGFSMWSPPFRLEDESELDLAVKRSAWPPAHWVHTKAEVGSELSVKIGGNFHYPNDGITSPDHHLLLVAGGVGINPIASIVFHIQHLKQTARLPSDNSIQLLFSAKTSEELLFREKFEKISDPYFRTKYFVTSSSHAERIDKNVLEKSVDSFCRTKPVFCFVCGPNSMIKSVESELVNLGLDKRHIFHEMWW